MPSPKPQSYRDASEVWGAPKERWIVCPSGARCQVRDLEMEQIAETGLIDQMDSLGMLVEEEHVARVQGKRPQDRAKRKPTKKQQEQKEAAKMAGILRDPEQFKTIGVMLEKVAVACVLDPVLESPYIVEDGVERKLRNDERLEGALYADSVGFGDKMHIFEQVFRGMGDLETFREGRDEDVADVADESGSEEDSE